MLLWMMAEQAAKARRALPPEQVEALLASIAQGDQAAFEEFYRASGTMVYAYALSLARNHQDAQDVMMETFLHVRTGAQGYRPQGKPLAWVFTIARNAFYQQQRARGREEPMDAVENISLPLSDTDRSDDAIVLRQAMAILGVEERQIVVLHAVTGLRHREIAQVLGLPLSTVLSKYNRALGKLRKSLAEEG